MITNPLPMHPGKVLAKVYMSQMVHIPANVNT
jgi:hypothetical protein